MRTKQRGISVTAAHVIRGMAQNRLRVRDTARAMHYSDQTISYHVKHIRELTGKDPRDFFDMCELLKMADEVLKKEEAAGNG